jgi:hypothetical protein
MSSTISTPYGRTTVGPDSVLVTGNGSELRAWAARPGAAWPCSELAEASEITAVIDADGLVDLTGDDCIDLGADEFNAWSSDVLRAAGLPESHPAYFVAVGQFA